MKLKSQFGCLLLFMASLVSAQNFIEVKNGQFYHKDKVYKYLGTNFWYGMNLGADDQERLLKELDKLSALGVKNLRIMATSEGDSKTPWSMQPSLQPKPGEFNIKLLNGLDFLLAEMGKRDMKAVICLNNFWPWSGGFPKYVSWAKNNETIPYPPPAEGGDWRIYQEYSAQFYNNVKAQEWYRKTIAVIVNRTNSITKKLYKEDPTIMSWQLANEPEGVNVIDDYRNWVDQTARYIKSLDSNHLVSIGSEGYTPSEKNGTDFRLDHKTDAIDYFTFHLWVQNWGWYDPQNSKGSYDTALKSATDYIMKHINVAKEENKPLVLEEFGIGRDGDSYDWRSSVLQRDKYYDFIFNFIYSNSKKIPVVSGVNFWAWGGIGRPSSPRSIWKPGDDFTGDPPHEYQGWYSVYDTDLSTIKIIKDYAKKFNQISILP